MFRFYKTLLNVKTRLQEQNLKKILLFFSLSFKLFICCITKLKIKLNFLKGDTNIYFEYITLFEKKNFTEKNKTFVKIIHIFFLKIFFFFQIVLLDLNNHMRATASATYL